MSCAKDCGRQPIYAKFAQRPRWKRRRERGLQKKRGTGRCLALHFTADAESVVCCRLCFWNSPVAMSEWLPIHGNQGFLYLGNAASSRVAVPRTQNTPQRERVMYINLRIKAKLVKKLAFKQVEILDRITEFCAC